MTRHQVISKAQKIASRMKSPFPNEVAIASMKLKQLLDEYSISMKDVGLGNLDVSNMVNKTTHEVIQDADNNDIKEFIYKKPISKIPLWFLCVLLKIVHAYEAMIIGDRYGTWADKSFYLKIICFPENIKDLKSAIVNIRFFIETQISLRGYTEKAQIANYALGISDTITKRIRENIDLTSNYESQLLSRSKSVKLSEYLYKCYGLTTDSDDPIDLGRDDDAYRTGLYDGHNFFRQNSCKEAFSEALKNRAETAMPKTPYYSSVETCRRG